MASRPVTPSEQMPEPSDWRFCPVGIPTEWAEDYRPGNLHPIHLGEFYNDGRYKILRKLGYGSYSTVWLAKDERLSRYVALKFLTAKSTASETESTILRHVAQSNGVNNMGKDRILLLQDYFKHRGPNGEHACLVFDAMGPSAASMVEYFSELKYASSEAFPKDRYPIWMANSMLRQILLGISFLHQSGLVHGDLQPGNLLFSVKDLDSIPEDRLVQKDIDPAEVLIKPIRRMDGKADLWGPKYLALGQPLETFVNLEPDFVIKISDMGGAFYMNDPPEKLVTPVGLRCPETILKQRPTSTQDIWSFGCLIFEFITGRPLFVIDPSGDDDTDDDHFLRFYDILGPLPLNFLSEWKGSPKYFNSDGNQYKNWIGNPPEGKDLTSAPRLPTLETFFDNKKPSDLSNEDSEQIKQILKWVLQYDSTKRPSARKLLEHPWFANPI